MTPNLSVDIAGIQLKNPVVTASGTYGFGREYAAFFPPSALGAVAVKGLTLKERAGNAPPRVAETPAGMLNSVGLQNPGVEAFIREDLPWLKAQNAVVIANIAGSTVEDYCAMAERLSDTAVDLIDQQGTHVGSAPHHDEDANEGNDPCDHDHGEETHPHFPPAKLSRPIIPQVYQGSACC